MKREGRLQNKKAALRVLATPLFSFRVFRASDKMNAMTPEEQVQIILAVAEENAGIDQAKYHAALTARGVPLHEAQDSYRLVQIAFGRFLMKGMGVRFSPDCWRYTESGEHRATEQLENHPVFRAAQKVSPTQMTKPVIDALVLTSPELKAVNDLMQQGSKSEDLALAPVVLFEGNPDNAAIQKAGEHMRRHLNDAAETEARKPWWKVWP